jgi:hypothetical protein
MTNYKKIEKLVSKPRIDRFYIAAGGSHSRAVKIYKLNLKLAAAFHPLLSQFEVILRNKLDDSISHFFNDPDWITKPELKLSKRQNEQIAQTLKKLSIKEGTVSKGKVIASQTFGFWTEMLGKDSFKILRGSPIHAFKFRPSTCDRKNIFQKLEMIRLFRNRINHNEPICFEQNNFSTEEAKLVHATIYELSGWLEYDVSNFLKSIDSTKKYFQISDKKFPKK